MSLAALLIVGTVLLAMGLGERLVRRLPLSPSLVYLGVGWAAASLWAPNTPLDLREHGALLLPVSEAVLLLSLFAIGLRLGRPAPGGAWRLAMVLASGGLLVTIALVALAGWALLALPWGAALLLAEILSPTDPVLASDVQMRSVEDRDAVRLTLTVEGAINDGTAFPVVMLALAALGVHEVGAWGGQWLLRDLLWPVGGGAALGWVFGWAMGAALRALRQRGHELAWDELLYLGAIALVYAAAVLLHLSTFLAVFACGCALFTTRGDEAASPAGRDIGADALPAGDCNGVRGRMIAFGGRIERIAEASMVLLIGWFGIRGVGSLFYLGYALEHGLTDGAAGPLVDACLLCIAGSIVLHGLSATPLMEWARRWPMSRPCGARSRSARAGC